MFCGSMSRNGLAASARLTAEMATPSQAVIGKRSRNRAAFEVPMRSWLFDSMNGGWEP
jgi:hypothetical protein